MCHLPRKEHVREGNGFYWGLLACRHWVWLLVSPGSVAASMQAEYGVDLLGTRRLWDLQLCGTEAVFLLHYEDGAGTPLHNTRY